MSFFKEKILLPIYNLMIGNGKQKKKIIQKYHIEKNKPNIAIIGTPNHGNLGDYAIFLAEEALLSKAYPNANVMEVNLSDFKNDKLWLKKILKEKDLLILTGGGNLGNLYMDDENTRRETIALFPNNPIVMFPQTMHYSDDAAGIEEKEKAAKLYGSHKKLLLAARDELSFEAMKKNFSNKVILLPDVVLTYTPEIELKEERKGALLALRSDKEGRFNEADKLKIQEMMKGEGEEITLTDTEILGRLPLKILREETLQRMKLFSGAKVVVTDRLHGMVFAAITGTPCAVFNNYNHKVRETYKWISHLPYIRLVENIEDLPKVLHELGQIKSSDIVYDNQDILKKYETFLEEIAHVS